MSLSEAKPLLTSVPSFASAPALQAGSTATSKHLVDAACDPNTVPAEVRDFWVAYLDETRFYDVQDWWKNWTYGLKTWKCVQRRRLLDRRGRELILTMLPSRRPHLPRGLYAAFLCPVGHKYAVLLSVLSKRLVHVANQVRPRLGRPPRESRAPGADCLAATPRPQQDTDVACRQAMNEFYQPIRDAMTQALKDT